LKIQRDEPQENMAEKVDKSNDKDGIAGTPPLSKPIADDSDDFPASTGNISIKTAMDIRRLLVSVINQLRQKQIGVQRARAIIYASHELLAVFAQVDLEERIRKLEELSGYGGR
jgi:hypothetical protein